MDGNDVMLLMSLHAHGSSDGSDDILGRAVLPVQVSQVDLVWEGICRCVCKKGCMATRRAHGHIVTFGADCGLQVGHPADHWLVLRGRQVPSMLAYSVCQGDAAVATCGARE
jgi:hypothetical protein